MTCVNRFIDFIATTCPVLTDTFKTSNLHLRYSLKYLLKCFNFYTVWIREFPWASKLIKSDLLWIDTSVNDLKCRVPIDFDNKTPCINWTTCNQLNKFFTIIRYQIRRIFNVLELLLRRMQHHLNNSIYKLLCPSVCQSISLHMNIKIIQTLKNV